jgi:hypothetical protein
MAARSLTHVEALAVTDLRAAGVHQPLPLDSLSTSIGIISNAAVTLLDTANDKNVVLRLIRRRSMHHGDQWIASVSPT